MKIENPAKLIDPWAPDFEVGGGCWIYKHDDRCYAVRDIRGDQIFFTDGADGLLMLTVCEASTLMRPT